MPKRTCTLLVLLSALAAAPIAAAAQTTLSVTNSRELLAAVSSAKPGTRILLAPGNYEGGLYFNGPKGTAGKPIVLAAADPARPPVFRGGGDGLHFSEPEYLELDHLVIDRANLNGVNIDDGGTFDTPAHHVVLRGVVIRDNGPKGNLDGLKLSGLDDFQIDNCVFERWGDGGSAIDMVGCHRGVIERSTFRHKDNVGADGVQAKGGTRDLVVRACRFEHAGSRAVQIGGSTGLAFFRPKPEGFEAKDVTVERCTFVGSDAPVAFVNADGATVRFNTIYRPTRWVVRILQETRSEGFVPCRNGRFTDNLVVFRAGELADAVNVGSATSPGTFEFARNFWYCTNNPAKSKLALPVAETDGVYGQDPQLRDAEKGDLRLQAGSPAKNIGADAIERKTGS
ncbi:MAG: right-handed parallel beta-helix repeat-containing protein [Pirellulales bacterium]